MEEKVQRAWSEILHWLYYCGAIIFTFEEYHSSRYQTGKSRSWRKRIFKNHRSRRSKGAKTEQQLWHFGHPRVHVPWSHVLPRPRLRSWLLCCRCHSLRNDARKKTVPREIKERNPWPHALQASPHQTIRTPWWLVCLLDVHRQQAAPTKPLEPPGNQQNIWHQIARMVRRVLVE